MALLDEILSQLQTRDPLPLLFPKREYSHDISHQILSLSGDEHEALICGLLLLNDDLHASHDISQGIKTPTGSFWHAIMHRREGDAGNANYWWRLTGEHPAFALIFENAREYLHNRSEPQARAFAQNMERHDRWSPVDFTRSCSDAGPDASPNDEWLRGLQMIEMTTLLAWCRNQN